MSEIFRQKLTPYIIILVLLAQAFKFAAQTIMAYKSVESYPYENWIDYTSEILMWTMCAWMTLKEYENMEDIIGIRNKLIRTFASIIGIRI